MSFYQVSNPTNGRSSTLANALKPAPTSLPPNIQQSAAGVPATAITSSVQTPTPLAPSQLEACTTNIRVNNVDVGAAYSSYYVDSGAAAATTNNRD